MHGVTTRLPRVAHEPLKYKEWIIPPNVGDDLNLRKVFSLV